MDDFVSSPNVIQTSKTLIVGEAEKFRTKIDALKGISVGYLNLGTEQLSVPRSVSVADFAGTVFAVPNLGIDGQALVSTGATSQPIWAAGLTFYSATVASRDSAAGDGNVNYAHGLGHTPAFVRITMVVGNTVDKSFGYYKVSGGTYALIHSSTVAPTAQALTDRIVYYNAAGGTSTGTIDSVDSTNVTIAWAKGANPVGTMFLFIETFA